MAKEQVNATKGVLDALMDMEEENKNSKEVTNKNSKEVKNENSLEEKSKRSYALKNSTIKKLEELKLFNYPVGTNLEDIVDEAICYLYDNKGKK